MRLPSYFMNKHSIKLLSTEHRRTVFNEPMKTLYDDNDSYLQTVFMMTMIYNFSGFSNVQ